MCVLGNIEARPGKHCCSGKAIGITYSGYVFAVLVIQHAKRVRHIKLPYVACPSLPYFPPLCHKRHDFREKFTEHTECLLTFSANFVRNIFHSKRNAEICDLKCTRVGTLIVATIYLQLIQNR